MHSENSAVLKKLSQKLKQLLPNYKLIEDIIIFGSLVREKTHPKDVDIALLVHERDEEQLEKIEKELRSLLEGFKIDITILTVKEVYSPLWLSIMKEGYSVSNEEFLPTLYGIKPEKLYKYSIKMLTPVQKVQFDRGMRKMIEDLSGIRLTRTVILIPFQKSKRFEEFLKTWKIEFETQRYELLPEHQKTAKIVAWRTNTENFRQIY